MIDVDFVLPLAPLLSLFCPFSFFSGCILESHDVFRPDSNNVFFFSFLFPSRHTWMKQGMGDVRKLGSATTATAPAVKICMLRT